MLWKYLVVVKLLSGSWLRDFLSCPDLLRLRLGMGISLQKKLNAFPSFIEIVSNAWQGPAYLALRIPSEDNDLGLSRDQTH